MPMCSRILLIFLIFCASLKAIGSGDPARPYFQQSADHTIHVTLDDRRHILNAVISTLYTNNSPDTLGVIYVHLWPNAYSSKETAFARQMRDMGRTDFHFAEAEEMGYIDSLDFRVDALPVQWELDARHPDIGIIELTEPLLPGRSIRISTPFRVKIPSAGFSRLGHDEQAYYITQWYPKPAVYDREGWHPMPYLEFGEYYSEFGNVDVFLTLPDNYVVASTGKVMTQEEEQWLSDLSDSAGRKGDGKLLPPRLEFPPSSKTQKTIHLRRENVHDFAWFADKRFYVLRDSIDIPGKEEAVLVSAFFHREAEAWSKVPAYTSGTLLYMSDAVSLYPWDGMSVVQGVNSAGSGMEYPAVTLIGKAPGDFGLERVVVHETIHNWFYGKMAFNERRHPWLDEGLTSFYEHRYLGVKHPDRRLLGDFSGTALAVSFGLNELTQEDYMELAYLFSARTNLDQPMNLHTEAFSALNYFIMTYYKAALSFMYLEEYLGHEVFDAAMKVFAGSWAMKHPGPEQLREAFEEQSGRELAWFFEGLAATTRKIDYAIKDLEVADDHFYLVEIENRGGPAVPFSLAGVRKDSLVMIQWQEGFEGSRSFLFPKGDYELLQINSRGLMPEINRRNNNYWFDKRLPGQNPLEMQLLGSIEDPEINRINYLPVLGLNKYNGLMAGVAFYNYVFPSRPTELFLMPMYGLGNDRLAGAAWAYRSFYPERGLVQAYRAGVNGRRYGFTPGNEGWSYNRLQASIAAILKKPHAGHAPDRGFSLTTTMINRSFPVLKGEEWIAEEKTYWIHEAGFSWDHNRSLNPYSFGINLEQGEGFAKLSGQARFFRHYPSMPKGVSIRFFAGTFLKSPEVNSLVDYRFRLGGPRGIHDYAYETPFLGRSEAAGTFWGNQITEKDGGFKYPSPVGQTWEWLMAVNLKADFPALPLKGYLDLGTYSGASTAFNGSRTFSWVLGVQFVPVKGFLEINFPIAVSSDIRQVADFAFDTYFQQVTFSLHLDKANPFRYLRDLSNTIMRTVAE